VHRLSIVIPVVGDSRQLDDTLVSVLENRPNHCEILVVHNEPYDDPYQLGDEVVLIEARRGAGLAECLNLGISASQAPVVNVLSCGVEVRPGWADAALGHFQNPDVAAVAAVVLAGDDRTVFSAGLAYRAEGTPWKIAHGRNPTDSTVDAQYVCGPDLLSGFYRRSVLELLDGFSTSAGNAMTAIDAALALRYAGFHCVLEPECLARVDATTVSEPSNFARGRDAERLFWRWASYHGWTRSLVGHIAMIAGECVVSLWRPSLIGQLAGRLWGAARARSGAKRPDRASVEALVVAAPQLADAPLSHEQHAARAA
jgi:O-antigen biosynthesis protein